MSPAEVCFIKAELVLRGIVNGSDFDITNYISKGVEYSLSLWMQLPYNGTDVTYKYIYNDLANLMKDKDIYSFAYSHSANILNEQAFYNPDFGFTPDEYFELVYQQRWLDLFRQPNEAWNLARRTFKTPTTTDHQKLVSYRLPYPQSEVTYNYDNYNEQVKKMSHGDTRETKVWWMK